MLAGDELCVTDEARAVASAVFRPPLPVPLRPTTTLRDVRARVPSALLAAPAR